MSQANCGSGGGGSSSSSSSSPAVTVPAAVLAYGQDGVDADMLVGYAVKYTAGSSSGSSTGSTAAVDPRVQPRWASVRFSEWGGVRKALVQVDRRVRGLGFPEKEALRHLGTHIFKSTNRSKNLIEARRAALDRFVRGVVALGSPQLTAALVRVVFDTPSPSASRRALDINPPAAPRVRARHGGGNADSSSTAAASDIPVDAADDGDRDAATSFHNTFRFPRDRLDRPLDTLFVKLPWGYLDHSGAAHITADTASDAALRFEVFIEMYRWYSRLVDKLPSFTLTTSQTRMYMEKKGLPALDAMLRPAGRGRVDSCCAGTTAATAADALARGSPTPSECSDVSDLSDFSDVSLSSDVDASDGACTSSPAASSRPPPAPHSHATVCNACAGITCKCEHVRGGGGASNGTTASRTASIDSASASPAATPPSPELDAAGEKGTLGVEVVVGGKVKRRRCLRRSKAPCAGTAGGQAGSEASVTESESELSASGGGSGDEYCCTADAGGVQLPPTYHDPFVPVNGVFELPDGGAVEVALSLTEASGDEQGHVHYKRVPTRRAQRHDRMHSKKYTPNTDVDTWNTTSTKRRTHRTY